MVEPVVAQGLPLPLLLSPLHCAAAVVAAAAGIAQVLRAEDAGAFAAELLQSGFVNFGLSPIEMCAQHHPAALQPWHYDAAFYL